MENLRKQVARAHRRLMLGQFFATLAWCWSVALLVAAAAIAAVKIWPIGVDSWTWVGSWIGGALVAGLLAAGVVDLAPSRRAAGGRNRDRPSLRPQRAGFERAGSCRRANMIPTLVERSINDAIRRVERIDVGSRFTSPVGPPQSATGIAGVACLRADVRFRSRSGCRGQCGRAAGCSSAGSAADRGPAQETG